MLPWTVEAKAGRNADRTQRIKLTLQPVDGQGNPANVSSYAPQRPE